MAPRLCPGALVIASPVNDKTQLRVGDIVVAHRPDRPQLEIIKRIRSIDATGAVFLAGDNALQSTDSRDFGAVPRNQIVARVRWRYWPLPPVRL